MKISIKREARIKRSIRGFKSTNWVISIRIGRVSERRK